jgi:hypothetical protein
MPVLPGARGGPGSSRVFLCPQRLELYRAIWGKFRRSRRAEYLSIGGDKTATKMALKLGQMVLKYVQTGSCEEKFLNLCLSMGNKKKGRGAFLMIGLKFV